MFLLYHLISGESRVQGFSLGDRKGQDRHSSARFLIYYYICISRDSCPLQIAFVELLASFPSFIPLLSLGTPSHRGTLQALKPGNIEGISVSRRIRCFERKYGTLLRRSSVMNLFT